MGANCSSSARVARAHRVCLHGRDQVAQGGIQAISQYAHPVNVNIMPWPELYDLDMPDDDADSIDYGLHGVSTRVEALEHPAVRRLSVADTKAVTWMWTRRPERPAAGHPRGAPAGRAVMSMCRYDDISMVSSSASSRRTLDTPQLHLGLLILALILLEGDP